MIRFCLGADRGAHWKTAESFVVAERHRAERTRTVGSIAFGPSQPGSSSPDHSAVGFRREQSQHRPTTESLEPDGVPLAQEMVRSGPCRTVRRGEARAPENPRRRASGGASAHRPRQQSPPTRRTGPCAPPPQRPALRKARSREPSLCSAYSLTAPNISSCPPIRSSLTRSGTLLVCT
jgi:hypothetical protein